MTSYQDENSFLALGRRILGHFALWNELFSKFTRKYIFNFPIKVLSFCPFFNHFEKNT